MSRLFDTPLQQLSPTTPVVLGVAPACAYVVPLETYLRYAGGYRFARRADWSELEGCLVTNVTGLPLPFDVDDD